MQKITPSLWFDKECEEAINLYVDIFNNSPHKREESKIISIQRYEKGIETPGAEEMEGKILTAIFELAGHRFMALDGGPTFKMNPSISFTVHCKDEVEINYFWEALSKGGNVLMPLQKYDFAEKYGWVSDRFGVSWQLSIAEGEQKIVPSMLFVGEVAGKAHEAINFYTSTFPNSKIEVEVPYAPEENEKPGAIKFSSFELFNQKFIAMDSSLDHKFSFNEGISLFVECEDQEEVDKYWNMLTADGGEESVCGWLKDKFGLSWQIVPKRMGELMSDPNKEKVHRVANCMLKMNKIIIADLEKAANENLL